jgi:DNA repair protein RadA/Sms
MQLGPEDVFVNVVGGLKIAETAADLPTLLSVVSSFRDRPCREGLVSFGEVGLAGEVRPVRYGEERISAAAQQGFACAIVPRANAPRKPPAGIEVIAVSRIREALDAAF